MSDKRETSSRREILKHVGRAAVAAPAVALLFSATKVSASVCDIYHPCN